MKQSESVKGLLESLVKAQAEFTTLPKDKAGYGYKYTDLDTVITTVRPVLVRYNLGFAQSLTTMESGKNAITTRVFSAGGEYLEDTIALPDIQVGKTNAAQNMGAAITYMKRYALCAILGISSDEDTDAVIQENKPAQQTKAPVQKKAPVQQKTGPMGGPDTPEQKKNIEYLLGSVDNEGVRVFNAEDIKKIGPMRMEKTADEVIAWLREELKKRIAVKAPAPSYEQASMGFEGAEAAQPNIDGAIF